VRITVSHNRSKEEVIQFGALNPTSKQPFKPPQDQPSWELDPA
jgi:hypothetical protein